MSKPSLARGTRDFGPEIMVKRTFIFDQIKKVLKYCKTPKSRLEVLSIMGMSNHFYNFKRHILPLIEQNLIEYTKKENSKDRNQKYVTTQKGNSRLKG